MKTRTLAITALVLAILAVLAWGAVRVVRTAAAPAVTEPPVTRVRRGAVTITITARGDLQGGNPEMLLAPMVGGDTLTVTMIRQPGELVGEGDVVAEFDTTQQEYNLRESAADLAEAQQKVIQTEAENQAGDEETRYALEAARTQVKLAELELRKNPIVPAITARQNAIALEAAKNRLRQAEQDMANKKTTEAAGLDIQKAAENKARVMASMAQKNIDSMTLKAKSAGYVNLQPNTFGTYFLTMGMTLPTVQIGDTVRAGMPVAQIPDLKSWEVRAMVAEVDRGHLAVGQAVSIAVVALAGKAFPGHVINLGATTGQPWDRRFECRMGIDRPGPELRPGMSSNLVITAEKLDNVLWVPSQVLFERDGHSFVYFKTANGFIPRDVILVKRSESQAVIKGLKEGDVLALSNPAEQNKPAGAESQSAMKALPK